MAFTTQVFLETGFLVRMTTISTFHPKKPGFLTVYELTLRRETVGAQRLAPDLMVKSLPPC